MLIVLSAVAPLNEGCAWLTPVRKSVDVVENCVRARTARRKYWKRAEHTAVRLVGRTRGWSW